MKIKGVRVVPSQANFVIVELESGLSPQELLKRLLTKHNLLIKELSTKTNGRNYLRLAVRNSNDNDILVSALKAELM
jgi:histidinol-phosphate/aromatic aminotransferase/cobyric acid decarboxylase-like protein